MYGCRTIDSFMVHMHHMDGGGRGLSTDVIGRALSP